MFTGLNSLLNIKESQAFKVNYQVMRLNCNRGIEIYFLCLQSKLKLSVFFRESLFLFPKTKMMQVF